MDSNLSSSWHIFLEEMNARLSNEREFNIWFKPLEPVSMQDNTLTIRVPSQDYSFKLEDDYFDIFKAALEKGFGEADKSEVPDPDQFANYLDSRGD